jgi:riboflavin kinase/FMN adenylyltransferase
LIITNKLDKNLFASTSLALGVFDGIHFAHQKVLEDVIEKSKKYGALPAVITFSNHPQNVLIEKRALNIISTEKKLELLKDFGIRAVVLLEFTKDMAYLSAEDYLKMIIDSMNPKSITLGYNHNFGKDKKGNGDFLRANSEKYGYETSVISSVEIDGHIVSSSLIRKLLSSGKIELVNKLLKRDYSISSQIVEGAKKGRTIGFPTINTRRIKCLFLQKMVCMPIRQDFG